jgi:alpha-2-macroglobulin
MVGAERHNYWSRSPGLEPLNPAFKTTGSIPQGTTEQQGSRRGFWWRSSWFEHQNLRDERVEAFASLLWEGVYEYSYVAIATTPGTCTKSESEL